MAKNYIFTSESVCSGHPDKICDQISDAILDKVLEMDPKGRVAIETLVTTNQIVIAGEVTAKKLPNYEKIARQVVKNLGYTDPQFNFTDQAKIDVLVHGQSLEIGAGVDNEGAGDQGMMFGYACKETKNFMPLPIELAHKLAETLDKVRIDGKVPYLRPDGKTQVSVEYKNGKPFKITNAVIAVPHSEKVDIAQVKMDLFNKVVKKVLNEYGFDIKIDLLTLNGTGFWHIGGPDSDTGLTGRKIVVDGYGGYARVGGGAFSGKDPTKVDRSGAYGARYIAKNIVAQGLADQVEVRLAYCIGQAKPLMQQIETFGSARVPEKVINQFVKDLLDTSVRGIIENLDLLKPLYFKTASYGHFGRDIFPWEKIK